MMPRAILELMVTKTRMGVLLNQPRYLYCIPRFFIKINMWKLLSLLCDMLQANKEEDDKMRTNAANVATRAAVGEDDMLSKWQLMSVQAQQKREVGVDTSSSSQPAKGVSRKSSSTSGRSMKDNQEGDKKGSASLATSGDILVYSIALLSLSTCIYPSTALKKNLVDDWTCFTHGL